MRRFGLQLPWEPCRGRRPKALIEKRRALPLPRCSVCKAMKFKGDKNNASNAVSFSNETTYTAASGLELKEKINSKDEISIEASKKDVFLKVRSQLHPCCAPAVPARPLFGLQKGDTTEDSRQPAVF